MKGRRVFFLTAAVLSALFVLQVGPVAYESGGGVMERFAYMWFHANVFHLAGNIYASWFLLKSTTDLVHGYVIAAAAAFICPSSVPVVGFSSVLYAVAGMRAVRWRWLYSAYTLIFILAGGVMHMAVSVHLACFVLGIVDGAFKKMWDDSERYCT